LHILYTGFERSLTLSNVRLDFETKGISRILRSSFVVVGGLAEARVVVITVVVVVKVPEITTNVTNVCMIESGVGVEVTGSALDTAVGVKDEVARVATGMVVL
jgi:hypothetical protein